MKILKKHICKPCGVTISYATFPVLRFCGKNCWLNAFARDFLNNPDYISLDYDESRKILTISPSCDPLDFKLTKSTSGQSFSALLLFRTLPIENNTRYIADISGNSLKLNFKKMVYSEDLKCYMTKGGKTK